MLHSNIVSSVPLDSSSTVANRLDNLIYKICLTLFLCGFTTLGFGNFLFGLELATNVSTFFIYLIFLVQLASNSLRFSKFLFFLWLYIFIQTFILNWFYIDFQLSFKHFIGFIIFSLVTFSFFSKYRLKIFDVIQFYYKYCFVIACLAIFQVFLFAIFSITFLPQNILSGSLAFQGNNTFTPEILGIFPRAVGLSTEPAHYVAVLLPAVYISIYTLTGNKELFKIGDKAIAFTILFAFIISFSLVGYFGLALCLFVIFRKNIKIGLLKICVLLFGFIGLLYFILQTSIGDKVYSFIAVSKDITGTQYTSGDQSSFALLSNLMVAFESLKVSNFLGTGLNSHVVTYDATMSKLFSVSQITAELNKENAGSMFIRIVSEFGLPGLVAFIWLVIYFKVDKKIRFSSNSATNNMCFIFMIMYCSRNGDYLNILFFFFFSMYYYTHIISLTEVNQISNE